MEHYTLYVQQIKWQTSSAVTVTEPKPRFLSEPWRTETEVYWSHVSGFNQGNFRQVI